MVIAGDISAEWKEELRELPNYRSLDNFAPCSFETHASQCYTFDLLLFPYLLSFLVKISLITNLVQWNESNGVCVVHLVISILSL